MNFKKSEPSKVITKEQTDVIVKRLVNRQDRYKFILDFSKAQ